MKRFIGTLMLLIFMIAMQLSIIAFDLWQLMHWSDYPQWSMAMNCVIIPVCAWSAWRLSVSVRDIWQLWRRHQERLSYYSQQHMNLVMGGKFIRGPEEVAQYLKDVEAIDPELAKDLRKNLKDHFR
jgi:hypothetical protein